MPGSTILYFVVCALVLYQSENILRVMDSAGQLEVGTPFYYNTISD